MANRPQDSPHREAPNRHEKGTQKYREWVHKESKKSDDRNLPYKFSKPKRAKPRNLRVFCTECGQQTCVTQTTVAVICSKCRKLYHITPENSGSDIEEKVALIIGGADEE
jgi:ribosomal protein S27E